MFHFNLLEMHLEVSGFYFGLFEIETSLCLSSYHLFYIEINKGNVMFDFLFLREPLKALKNWLTTKTGS